MIAKLACMLYYVCTKLVLACLSLSEEVNGERSTPFETGWDFVLFKGKKLSITGKAEPTRATEDNDVWEGLNRNA